MAEHISNDDVSFQTGETDEDKSLESKDDTYSLMTEQRITNTNDFGANSNNPAVAAQQKNPNDSDIRVQTADTRDTKRNEDDSKRRRIRTVKKNLHEATLKVLETYLKTGDFLNESLEYEEVAAFDLKVHRYTEEKMRMRQGLIYPSDPSIAENVEEIVYEQIYQEEEFHAVGIEFFKNVLNDAHDMAGPSFIMHSKTCNWLKRAAGMTRTNDSNGAGQTHPLHLSDDSDDETEPVATVDPSTGAPKRITRTRIRQSRRKRRQEKLENQNKGLRVLAEVAKELEKGQGRRLKAIERKKNLDRAATGSDVSKEIAEEEGECHEADEDSEMRDFIPGTIGDDELVDLQHQAKPLFPILDSMDLLQLGLLNKYKDPVALGLLGWNVLDRQDRVNRNRKPDFPPGTVLPLSVANLGLEFCPSRLTIPERSLQHSLSKKDREGGHFHIPQVLYEANCKALENAIRDPNTRQWAIREFFCGDVDKEWLRKNDIIEDIEKSGIRISSKTRMTKTEWSLVRRKLRKRPRLFSKRYIAEQLKERNKHRSNMRQLQMNPEIKEFSTIPVGHSVTAYNKNYKTIRRGKVLLFDPKRFEYLVQFDTQDYGFEMCPDFEVASVKYDNGSFGGLPIYEPTEFSIPSEDDTCELVSNGDDKPEVKEETEREILVTILAVIKHAFDRKRTILKSLELLGETEDSSRSSYISWLLANLDQLNHSLQSALLHLQVMYGSAYATPASSRDIVRHNVKQKRVSNLVPDYAPLRDLLASLESISEKIRQVIAVDKTVSSCFNLMLLANCLAFADSSLDSSKIWDAALEVSLATFIESALPSTSEANLTFDQLEQESRIEGSLKELGEALGMLRAEVAGGRMHESYNQQHRNQPRNCQHS